MTTLLTGFRFSGVNDTHERPSKRRVLEILTEAGEEGIRGPDIARHFTGTPNLQRSLTWVNQITGKLTARGYARRSERTEPSPHYNNVPCWRWFITADGEQFLAAGLVPATTVAKMDADMERNAQRRRKGELITRAYQTYDTQTPKCVRETAITELRAEGCTLEDIGGVFGITRERVRQIVNGWRCRPCRCPRHGAPYHGGPGE